MATEPSTVVSLVGRTVDLVRQTVVSAAGVQLASLTTREAQLLAYLAARPEQDVSREELLDRVWSYRASYATRAVDVTMRRLRAKIEPDPQSPVHLISVHGVGYRFVPVPDATELAIVAEEPVSPRSGPLDERSDRAAFVGRRAELGALVEAVGGSRLVSVLGPGGIGKSRLVGQYAEHGAGRWSGGIWWCAVGAADGAPGVVRAVAAALGVVLTGGEPDLVIATGRALAGRGRSLVVLDAFERHVGHAVDTVGAWIEAAPETVFVVTSRERLRLTGERVVEVGPLAHADAGSLLLDRMAAAGIPVEDVDPSVVRRVVDRLDRLPLAIELAAPRARVMSLAELHSRLDERFAVLSDTAADGRTLRAVLDGSWDLLEPDEQRALTWCSAFVGGFTLEAAEAVLDVGADTWPLDRIEALRDKSLVRVLDADDEPGEPRLGLYDSVRDYAAERLTARGEVELVDARHAAYHVVLGEELADGIDRHGGLDRLRALEADADNLLAVVRRRRRVAPLDAVRALLALEPLFSFRGPAAVYGRLIDELVAEIDAEALAPDLRARLAIARGSVHRLAGDSERARAEIERGLGWVRGTGSLTETRGFVQLALVQSDAARPADAIRCATDALAVARSRGHRALEGTLLGMLAAFATMSGDLDEAERRFVDAIRIDHEVGNEPRAALDLANFGLVLTEVGRIPEAEDRLTGALALHRSWRNVRGMAAAHQALAMLRARQGRLRNGLDHATEALRLYREAGYTRFAALSAQNRWLLEWALGTPGDAVAGLREVVRALGELADPAVEGMARVYLAAAIACAGDQAAAEAELAGAAHQLEPVANPRAVGLLAMARASLAVPAARAGDRTARAEVDAAITDGARSPLYGVQFLAGLLRAELDRR